MRKRWVWFAGLAVVGLAVIAAVLLLAVALWSPRKVNRPDESVPVANLTPIPEPAKEPYVATSEFRVYTDPGRVFRRDATGKVLWSARLEGFLGGVRPPNLLADTERVYVSHYPTHEEGVTALSRDTGQIIWHSKGPGDRLLLDGDLLLAAQCGRSGNITAEGRWLVARLAATGAEVFRVPLPKEDFDPHPIRKVAGLFLVQTGWWRDNSPALLIDRQGRIRHQLSRQVLDGIREGEYRLLLTNREVMRLSPADKVVWTVSLEPHRVLLDAGEFLTLPGGDFIAFIYCSIADSGVALLRFDPGSGKLRWRALCAPLGTSHLQYGHQATVAVEEGQVKVVSRGSHGTFTEVLELGSGRQLSRRVVKD
jgi:hypothetical protein